LSSETNDTPVDCAVETKVLVLNPCAVRQIRVRIYAIMPNEKNEFINMDCNSCGRVRHEVIAKIDGFSDVEDFDDEFKLYTDTTFFIYQCSGCREIVVKRVLNFSEWDHPEVRYFPPRSSRKAPKWIEKLEYPVKSLLEEIYRSLDASNRCLPLMGARTLVDMVALEKVGDIGGFGKKLSELQKQGYISEKNRELLEATLDAGNAAAHRGYKPNFNIVSRVMDIVENLLESVYIFEEAAEEIKKHTPPRSHVKNQEPNK
jgi:uncharacterized protein DUF4145